MHLVKENMQYVASQSLSHGICNLAEHQRSSLWKELRRIKSSQSCMETGNSKAILSCNSFGLTPTAMALPCVHLSIAASSSLSDLLYDRLQSDSTSVHSHKARKHAYQPCVSYTITILLSSTQGLVYFTIAFDVLICIHMLVLITTLWNL